MRLTDFRALGRRRVTCLRVQARAYSYILLSDSSLLRRVVVRQIKYVFPFRFPFVIPCLRRRSIHCFVRSLSGLSSSGAAPPVPSLKFKAVQDLQLQARAAQAAASPATNFCVYTSFHHLHTLGAGRGPELEVICRLEVSVREVQAKVHARTNFESRPVGNILEGNERLEMGILLSEEWEIILTLEIVKIHL